MYRSCISFQRFRSVGAVIGKSLAMATLLTAAVNAVPSLAAPWQATGASESTPATSRVEDWVTITPADTGLTFQMPGQPELQERTFSAVAGKSTTVKIQIYNVAASHSFVFAANPLPETPSTMPQINETLDGAVKGAVARTLGKLVSAKKLQTANYHGREFVFECFQGDAEPRLELKVMSRVIVIKDSLYQFTYVAPKADFQEQQALKFLDSMTYRPVAEKPKSTP